LVGVLALGIWQLTDIGRPSVISQTRSVAPFNAVELAGSDIVTVRVGAPRSVTVHARRGMLDHVATRVLAGNLIIAHARIRHLTKGPINVSVTLPLLRSVTITYGGSGIITDDGIHAPSFTVTLAGSGLLRASGTTAHLDVALPGSGDVELDQLIARNARAVVSGSGRIVVTATRSLNASVTGDGVIQYKGNPAQLATNVTGAGAIVAG
jgi:hypothetical protein